MANWQTQENARLPLCLPQDCPVWRVRLPGRGTGSQWRYTLRGKERLKVAHDFTVKLKSLGKSDGWVEVHIEKMRLWKDSRTEYFIIFDILESFRIKYLLSVDALLGKTWT